MQMRWTIGVSRSPIEASRPVAGCHQFVFRSKSLKGTMNALLLLSLAGDVPCFATFQSTNANGRRFERS